MKAVKEQVWLKSILNEVSNVYESFYDRVTVAKEGQDLEVIIQMVVNPKYSYLNRSHSYITAHLKIHESKILIHDLDKVIIFEVAMDALKAYKHYQRCLREMVGGDWTNPITKGFFPNDELGFETPPEGQ